MKSILVTGFGPFSEISANPSEFLAENCNAPYRILDVSYDTVDFWVENLDPNKYDVILMLGYANRPTITPERSASNVASGIPDIHGDTRNGQIIPGGISKRTGLLWTQDLLAKLSGYPEVSISNDAGTYLCNYLYFKVSEHCKRATTGFLHVPSFDVIPAETQLKILGEIIRYSTA